MQYVVDCNVAVKWVYAEPGHALAREFLDRSIAREIDLIAPDLLYTEMASLLSKKHRRGVITAEQARTSFSYIQNAGLRIYETAPRVHARCSYP